MFVPTAAYDVLVCGRLLADATAPQLADLASRAGPGGLAPGTCWAGVRVRASAADPAEVTLTAVALAEPWVTPATGYRDYWGEPVTPELLHGYVTGAEEHWVGRGRVLAPRAVLVYEKAARGPSRPQD